MKMSSLRNISSDGGRFRYGGRIYRKLSPPKNDITFMRNGNDITPCFLEGTYDYRTFPSSIEVQDLRFNSN